MNHMPLQCRIMRQTLSTLTFLPHLILRKQIDSNALLLPYLKEQYPVTVHAPNLDFWTGCREIKRCEESKRTLKNPFASRLAGFNTTLKLLRITDQ